MDGEHEQPAVGTPGVDGGDLAAHIAVVEVAPAVAVQTFLDQLARRAAPSVGRDRLGVGVAPRSGSVIAIVAVAVVAIDALARDRRPRIGRRPGIGRGRHRVATGIGRRTTSVRAGRRHAVGWRPWIFVYVRIPRIVIGRAIPIRRRPLVEIGGLRPGRDRGRHQARRKHPAPHRTDLLSVPAALIPAAEWRREHERQMKTVMLKLPITYCHCATFSERSRLCTKWRSVEGVFVQAAVLHKKSRLSAPAL